MAGKPKADNSQVVQQQQAEAAAAAQKEAARQQRLTSGLASIRQAFEGGPTYASQSTPYDWSTFRAPAFGQSGAQGVPPGWTAVQAPSRTPGQAAGGMGVTPASFPPNPNYGQRGQQNPSLPIAGAAGASPAGASAWALKDPQGALHYQGDPFNYNAQVQTGTSGGFDDAFYNKYKQAVLDYYMPQVSKQYKKAGDELTYRLARSGNLLSSAANTDVADLAEQNTLNQANVRNQADQAAGDLRSQVSGEEQKAISQLYATEDPEVAANQALSSVRDISLQTPQTSPLGALFNVADIGGANFLKGYQGQQALNAFQQALRGGALGGGGSGARGQIIRPS